ncbi:MAG: ATP-binding protein, partial [Spirochaetales bacterium]|nr:ATP-binding protein [Spirochaetales bacterium]
MRKEKNCGYYQNILNCLHDQVVVINRDLRIEYMNEAFESFILLNIEHPEFMEDHRIDQIFPDSMQGLIRDLKDCFSEGQVVRDLLKINHQNRDSFYDYVIFPNYEGSRIEECSVILRNITEIEMKKKELSQQVNFFSGLLKRIPIGVFMFDLNGEDVTLNLWNPMMARYFGRTEDDLLGKNCTEVFDPDTRKRHKKALVKILELGLFYEFPAELVKTREGSRFFHTIISPIGWTDGRPDSFMGIMEDISDKIAQQQKLKKYQKKLMELLETKSRILDDTTAEFSSILDNSYGINILSLDRNFCYRVFNSHFATQVKAKFDLQVEKGGSFFDLLPYFPLKGRQIKEALNQALEGKSSTRELTYFQPDGELGYLDGVFSPLYVKNQLAGVTLVFIDITDSKQLKREAEIFKSIADVVEYGVLLIDKDMNIRYTNSYWRRKLPIPEHKGVVLNLGDYLDIDQMQSLKELINDPEKKEQYAQQEYRTTDSSGNPVTLLINGVRFEESDGETVGLALSCLDITPISEARESLMESKDRAERTSQMKSAFVANMSHEIRTPLNAILGFASILNKSLTDPQLKDHADCILSSGSILKELINTVLDFSKLEASKMTIQPEATKMFSFFKDLYSLFSFQAREKRIFLEFICKREIPSVLNLDPLRLRQVVINLLGNALKFTHRGHIRVYINYSGEQHSLVLSVSDTGIGISGKDQQFIFNPFEQNEHHDSRTYEGTGLGLSIAKKLIDLMKGQISLESTPGQGSTFTIQVPAAVIKKEPVQFHFKEPGDQEPDHTCFVDIDYCSDALVNAGKSSGLRFRPVSGSSDVDFSTLKEPAAYLTRDEEFLSPNRFLMVVRIVKDFSASVTGSAVGNRYSYILDSAGYGQVCSILKSLFWQSEESFASGGFSVESLDPSQIEKLSRAVESRDFSDISNILPLVESCGIRGVEYGKTIWKALDDFDIPDLNRVLNSIKEA